MGTSTVIIGNLETQTVKFKMTFEVIWSRILQVHVPEIFMGVNANKGRFGHELGRIASSLLTAASGALARCSVRGPQGGREVPRIPALPPTHPAAFLEIPFAKETLFCFLFSPVKSPRKWNRRKLSAMGTGPRSLCLQPTL